jgi:putative hydrolase of the HAD superfamily
VVIRGLVVDIDDTLYLERDYVRSGFAAVAREVGRTPAEAYRLDAWLWAAFEAGARGDTFDRLRAAFPAVGARVTTADLVAAYRAHVPAIALADDTRQLLDRLRDAGLRLGVLSDGPVASQSAKAAALGLDRWFDPIVLTGAFGADHAKPGTAGFQAIAAAWRLGPADLVYVADNPAKDFAGPNRLGWTTVRLSRPGQLHRDVAPIDDDHRPDFVIGDLLDLPEALVLALHRAR